MFERTNNQSICATLGDKLFWPVNGLSVDLQFAVLTASVFRKQHRQRGFCYSELVLWTAYQQVVNGFWCYPKIEVVDFSGDPDPEMVMTIIDNIFKEWGMTKGTVGWISW